MIKKLLVSVFLCFFVFFSCSNEKKDWEEVKSENSITAYEEYLKQYPQGKFAGEARSQIETIYFEEAEAANTIEAYEGFLKRYAEGDFANRVRSKIEAIYFDRAKVANSVEAYEDFLAKYPEGDNADQARQMLEEIYPSFSKEKVLRIESMSSIVGKGEVSFQKGKESKTLNVIVKGIAKVFDNKDFCLFCLETVRIASNLEVPTSLFLKFNFDQLKGMKTIAQGTFNIHSKRNTGVKKSIYTAKDMVIDRIEIDLTLEVPYDDDSSYFLVGGPQGATLKKEGNGFRLVKGEAHLLRKRMK